MTIERAIEILNPEHRERYENIDIVNEACKMGMEALEKQINKNVRLAEDMCLCPHCSFDMMGVYDYPCEHDPKYCPECGQALKWRN